MAARGAPDGYTFVLAAAGVAINPSLYREVRFDPVKDIAAITHGISASVGRKPKRFRQTLATPHCTSEPRAFRPTQPD